MITFLYHHWAMQIEHPLLVYQHENHLLVLHHAWMSLDQVLNRRPSLFRINIEKAQQELMDQLVDVRNVLIVDE